MTNQQIQAKFNQLPQTDQKRILRTANEIKQCGRNFFWIETGCHADEPRHWWYVIEFVMDGKAN
jgi:hypothetical protein